jgi:hypothetical protein
VGDLESALPPTGVALKVEDVRFVKENVEVDRSRTIAFAWCGWVCGAVRCRGWEARAGQEPREKSVCGAERSKEMISKWTPLPAGV